MGRKRKSVKIANILFQVNHRNRTSFGDIRGLRQGWNSLLESILMDADLYKGFMYLEFDDVPGGEKPGILHTLEDGMLMSPAIYSARQWKDAERACADLPKLYSTDLKTFPDESRRSYFVHPALLADYNRLAGEQ